MQFLLQIFYTLRAAAMFACISMALYAGSWLFGVNFTTSGWIAASLIGVIIGLVINLIWSILTKPQIEDKLPSIFGWMATVAIVIGIYCRLYGVY